MYSYIIKRYHKITRQLYSVSKQVTPVKQLIFTFFQFENQTENSIKFEINSQNYSHKEMLKNKCFSKQMDLFASEKAQPLQAQVVFKKDQIIQYIFEKMRMPINQSEQLKGKIYKTNALKTMIVDLNNNVIDLYQKPFEMLEKYKAGILGKASENITQPSQEPRKCQFKRIKSASSVSNYKQILENIGNIYRELNIRLFNYFAQQYKVQVHLLKKQDIDYFNLCMDQLGQYYPIYEIEQNCIKHLDASNSETPEHSYFSISFQFKQDKLNCNRFYIGSNSWSSQFREKRDKLLLSRGILHKVQGKGQPQVAGIGYDLSEKIIKTYSFENLDNCPIKFLNKIDNIENYYNFCLFSQAFRLGSDELVETRYYFYAKDKKEMAPGITLPYTMMVSDKRGLLYQYDVIGEEDNFETTNTIKNIVNEKGKEVIDNFLSMNMFLDTIEYHNKDKFNLYYPSTLNEDKKQKFDI